VGDLWYNDEEKTSIDFSSFDEKKYKRRCSECGKKTGAVLKVGDIVIL
jgi:hypothetical protein